MFVAPIRSCEKSEQLRTLKKLFKKLLTKRAEYDMINELLLRAATAIRNRTLIIEQQRTRTNLENSNEICSALMRTQVINQRLMTYCEKR